MTDPTLFNPGPATGQMTARQTYVHALLMAHPDGLTAAQAGARLHRHLGKPCVCGTEQACKWASADGQSVLKSLRKRGLAKQLRDKTGRWQLAKNSGRSSTTEYDPATAPIPY